MNEIESMNIINKMRGKKKRIEGRLREVNTVTYRALNGIANFTKMN